MSSELNLDDRTFQDIVNEAKQRIPYHCPEWTDHNVSDPGVTLIELFAYMMESLVYKLNQVPDRLTEEFMKLFGVTRAAPEPARTRITFWFTEPANNLILPPHIEVSTTQTGKDDEPPVVFTTTNETEFKLTPPKIHEVSRNEEKVLDLAALSNGLAEDKGRKVFSDKPKVGDTLQFTFDGDISNCLIRLKLDFAYNVGVGIDNRYPPLVWEVETTPGEWEQVDTESDTLDGLNARSGQIVLHIPELRDPSRASDTSNGAPKELSSVRVRVIDINDDAKKRGVEPYEASPVLLRIHPAEIVGYTLDSLHGQYIGQEDLGESDGTPGQRFQLVNRPLLKRNDKFGDLGRLEVSGDQNQWSLVPDFSNSGVKDRHYTINQLDGEIRLGPAIRQRDGSFRHYGLVPPRGARLRYCGYFHGGGSAGNTEAGRLDTLKTSIPYVKQVNNRVRATGGKDEQSIEDAKMATGSLFFRMNRAVTADDFEQLTMARFGDEVAAVKCLPPASEGTTDHQSGPIRLLIIPKLSEYETKPSIEQLRRIPAEEIKKYLDDFRLLTTNIEVKAPDYVSISVAVYLNNTKECEERGDRIKAAFSRFLHPILGNKSGRGWGFNEKEINTTQLEQSIEDIIGRDCINELRLYRASEVPQEQDTYERSIKLQASELPVLGKCKFLPGRAS